jgi:hypothetical protein
MATKKKRPKNAQGFEKTSRVTKADNLFDNSFTLNNTEAEKPDDKAPDPPPQQK